MTHSPARSFWRGFVGALPFLTVIGPFGLLFGVVATEAGLDLFETVAMTVAVIAGASQFTALALLSDQAPAFIALLTALAVNLRLALYSASITPHLGLLPFWQRALVAYVLVDQTYGLSLNEYERRPGMPAASKLAYFLGSASGCVPAWLGFAIFGALAGEAIPKEYALDFAVPITFIALFAPMLRSAPHLVAAFVSILAALALASLPWSLGSIAAALLAMMAGAETERRLAGRRESP
ncbi:MAG TPA: AzlC family ABC transporter permease [Paracoccaceae bacterium]|nr:AzlC family ABC transporter permease [Paracoccaceae bacterium]